MILVLYYKHEKITESIETMNTSSLLSLRRSPHHSPVTSSSAPVTHSITQYKRDTAEHQKRYTAIWLYALFCIAYHISFLKLFRSSCSISLIFSASSNEIRMLIFCLYQSFACRSGLATTSPRKRDHVSGQKGLFIALWLQHCIYLLCLVNLDTEALTFFDFLS